MIYRGYEIEVVADHAVWKDEHGVEHVAENEDRAMDQIDAHRRLLRK